MSDSESEEELPRLKYNPEQLAAKVQNLVAPPTSSAQINDDGEKEALDLQIRLTEEIENFSKTVFPNMLLALRSYGSFAEHYSRSCDTKPVDCDLDHIHPFRFDSIALSTMYELGRLIQLLDQREHRFPVNREKVYVSVKSSSKIDPSMLSFVSGTGFDDFVVLNNVSLPTEFYAAEILNRFHPNYVKELPPLPPPVEETPLEKLRKCLPGVDDEFLLFALGDNRNDISAAANFLVQTNPEFKNIFVKPAVTAKTGQKGGRGRKTSGNIEKSTTSTLTQDLHRFNQFEKGDIIIGIDDISFIDLGFPYLEFDINSSVSPGVKEVEIWERLSSLKSISQLLVESILLGSEVSRSQLTSNIYHLHPSVVERVHNVLANRNDTILVHIFRDKDTSVKKLNKKVAPIFNTTESIRRSARLDNQVSIPRPPYVPVKLPLWLWSVPLSEFRSLLVELLRCERLLHPFNDPYVAFFTERMDKVENFLQSLKHMDLRDLISLCLISPSSDIEHSMDSVVSTSSSNSQHPSRSANVIFGEGNVEGGIDGLSLFSYLKNFIKSVLDDLVVAPKGYSLPQCLLPYYKKAEIDDDVEFMDERPRREKTSQGETTSCSEGSSGKAHLNDHVDIGSLFISSLEAEGQKTSSEEHVHVSVNEFPDEDTEPEDYEMNPEPTVSVTSPSTLVRDHSEVNHNVFTSPSPATNRVTEQSFPSFAAGSAKKQSSMESFLGVGRTHPLTSETKTVNNVSSSASSTAKSKRSSQNQITKKSRTNSTNQGASKVARTFRSSNEHQESVEWYSDEDGAICIDI